MISADDTIRKIPTSVLLLTATRANHIEDANAVSELDMRLS